VRKQLLEALRAEKIALPVPVKAGQSSVEELQVLLRALVGAEAAAGEGKGKRAGGEGHARALLRHRALRELVAAVCAVLDRSHDEHWEVGGACPNRM
jgi:hypothetical protein